jgi:hypothetical protein
VFENAWSYKLKRISFDGICPWSVALGIFKVIMHVFAVGMKLVSSINLIEGCNAENLMLVPHLCQLRIPA